MFGVFPSQKHLSSKSKNLLLITTVIPLRPREKIWKKYYKLFSKIFSQSFFTFGQEQLILHDFSQSKQKSLKMENPGRSGP